jgi:hypothetical protein
MHTNSRLYKKVEGKEDALGRGVKDIIQPMISLNNEHSLSSFDSFFGQDLARNL